MDPSFLLSTVKTRDSLSNVYPMLRDDSLRSVVQAWGVAGVSWDPPESLEDPPIDPRELLDLLWGFSRWDVGELSLFSGLSEEATIEALSRARSHGLIMPDGSVSVAAKKFLDMVVGQEVSKLAADIGKGKKGRDDKNDKRQ